MKRILCLLTLSLILLGCETAEPIPVEEPIIVEPVIEEPTIEEEPVVREGPSTTTDFGDVKPVIYLYPEQPTQVTVKLDYMGRITTEYPASEEGVWTVQAQPDGSLIYGGREYNYLFWEGISPLYQNFTFKDGFVIARTDYVAFLEEKLALLGLSQTEQADFISYWLPKMQQYDFVELRFLYEEYERLAKLTVTPAPDTTIRVFVMMKGLDQAISLPEQKLESQTRQGFTVVEWGGRFIQ